LGLFNEEKLQNPEEKMTEFKTSKRNNPIVEPTFSHINAVCIPTPQTCTDLYENLNSGNLDDQYNYHEQEEYIELHNGAAIDIKFFNQINAYARHRLPQLSPNQIYDLGTLLGEGIISLFDDVDYVFADMCMEHFAKRNLLPLITFRRRNRGLRIYILN
jgi:hypothetical protein